MDETPTVPLTAEPSSFADSTDYVVQLESEFPEAVPPPIEDAVSSQATDSEATIRRAA